MSQSNLEKIKELYQALQRGDGPAALGALDPEIVWYEAENFPYADRNNVLHNFLYAFLKVEEGKWIIGDYLMEPARVGKGIITPIENPQTSSAGGQQTKSPKKGDQRGEGR